jgi:hypothetical protein
VRVEVAAGLHHGIGIGAAVDLVGQRNRGLADDPPPLARVDQLAVVEGVGILVLREDEHLPRVDHVGLVAMVQSVLL